MRRFALALPLLLLTGCAAAAAPAAETAVPSSAHAAPEVPAATEVAAAVEADTYWNAQRLDALDRAKDKYPSWKDAAAKVAASGSTAAEPVVDAAPAPAAPPVAEQIVQQPPGVEPQPVPTAPPASAVVNGKISNEDFFLFLRGMIWTVNQDLITAKGLRIVLEDLQRNVDLTRKQGRVLRELLAEVDRVLAKGERPADPNWDFGKLDLPKEVSEPLPVKDLELLAK